MAKAPKTSEAPETPAAEKAKREKVTTTTYLRDGQPTKDPRAADSFRVEIVGGDQVTFDPATMPEAIRNAGEIVGFSILLKNAAGGKRGYEAYSAMMDRIETWEQGSWSAGGGGGPRVGMLAQAIVNLEMDKGRGIDAVKAALTASEEKRKAFAANPRVAAEVEKLKLAEQQERARLAAERAGAGDGEGDDLPDLDLD